MSFRTREGLRDGHLKFSSDQWPIFLYANYIYNPDDPWNGLLRSTIMIFVSVYFARAFSLQFLVPLGIQTYIHIS